MNWQKQDVQTLAHRSPRNADYLSIGLMLYQLTDAAVITGLTPNCFSNLA